MRRVAALAAVLLLTGCPKSPAPVEPGQVCGTPGATAEDRRGDMMVCRGRPPGRWERA